MADLIDTNLLVYRVDPRDPRKQEIAREVLRDGIAHGTVRIAHQAVVEFVAAVTRPCPDGAPILDRADALREAEDLLAQFDVLYPNEAIVRSALRAAAAYQLSWFDAHMWAHAEHFGLERLLSEDFEHGRRYGTVKVHDPFRGRARPRLEIFPSPDLAPAAARGDSGPRSRSPRPCARPSARRH